MPQPLLRETEQLVGEILVWTLAFEEMLLGADIPGLTLDRMLPALSGLGRMGLYVSDLTPQQLASSKVVAENLVRCFASDGPVTRLNVALNELRRGALRPYI